MNLRLALPIFFSKPVSISGSKATIGVILAFINHGGVIFSEQLQLNADKNDTHMLCSIYGIIRNYR